ncbi:chromate transporter [Ideonella sp. A 288]|uniref:chromate transporter n=1 Tax=Ideonella sp. A 288 TaxID=1962181 RepID=UPI001F3FFC57|nr:chromate transporter [Ideonella sp. A 288]
MSGDGWALLGLHGHGWGDLLQLTLHFMLLSMLAVGGAITTAPDMQRYLVQQQGWMSAEQFTASVAIAQAAPGPNILFVALMGWNVAGVAGVLATMGGIMLPSSVLALSVGRYGRRRADARPLRAFTTGMVPLTLGLLLSTGWILVSPNRDHWGVLALAAVTVVVMTRTRLSPMWLIALGAVVGMLGWA